MSNETVWAECPYPTSQCKPQKVRLKLRPWPFEGSDVILKVLYRAGLAPAYSSDPNVVRKMRDQLPTVAMRLYVSLVDGPMVCLLSLDGSRVGLGISQCSPTDNYEDDTGRRIAIWRALKDTGFVQQRRQELDDMSKRLTASVEQGITRLLLGSAFTGFNHRNPNWGMPGIVDRMDLPRHGSGKGK